MTMSDNEVQNPNSKQEGLTIVTENGFSSGQEVNKVKDSADGGGSMVEMTKSDTSAGENCAHPKREQSSTLQRKPKRSISFPQESCVSGYCDPPDPWKQAPKWTVQDVLTAYKKSCDKHGTKPLSKVLQQVEAFSCNGKRADKLVLKGEKIDMKQCETFEEILRRVQFKTVDLESCHLDDETAVALFDMIEFYESAQYLNISFNKNIGVRGWQACSRLIRRTPCLTTLDLRNCDMNDRSIPIFGRALKLGSHLTVLHMENMYLSGRSLILLVAALKMNEILQELFLADNRLMPSDGIQLGNLLKYNHSLTLLDLRNNHLQDVGVGHVCDGLYEQNLDKGLRTLVLWNNQVTYQAMASLSRALGSTKCLETLNLGHNNVTNEGIHILKEGLLKSKSLMRLGLQATRLTCEGAVALAEYVADSIHLLRLDLRENDIKTAGLMALSLALKVNESVTRMDLDKETKKESGMKDYADQQRRLQQDIGSYMERNQQAVLRREEEERRRLEERAQVEMAARASVQSAITSAQEAIQAHPEMMYVPAPSPEPEEKPRPSLLFQAHRLTPQESLESPHCSEVDFFTGKKSHADTGQADGVAVTVSSPPLSLELPNPLTAPQSSSLSSSSVVPPSQGSSDGGGGGGGGGGVALPLSKPTLSRLRSPPSELLLSPQYYPKPTARKIFSVSRVVEASLSSPTVSKTGVLDTGATGTSNTPAFRLAGGAASAGVGGKGAPSPISPTLLCQDLSAKTVNDYIQQIVSDPHLLNPGQEKEKKEEEEVDVRGGVPSSDPMEGSVEEGDREEQEGQKAAGRTVFPIVEAEDEEEEDEEEEDEEEEDEEEGSRAGMDPLGVMQVGTGSVSCDSVAGSFTAPCMLTDTVNPDKKRAAETRTPLKVEGEGSVSRDGDDGADKDAGAFPQLLAEAVSTNSDPELRCIPQSLSSLQEVVETGVTDVTTVSTTPLPSAACDSDPHSQSAVPDVPQDTPSVPQLSQVKDEFVSELEKLDREWDSQPEPVTGAEAGRNQNANFKKVTQPAPLSALEDSSLFRTLEFPDFDINEEDLSLFGGAATTGTSTASSKGKAATVGGDPEGEGAKVKGEGREASPSLGDTWTTVDAACLGEREEGGQGLEEEPDFFTALSMNGLTQELASVLSSIDGKVDMEGQENQCPASAEDSPQDNQDWEDGQSFA